MYIVNMYILYIYIGICILYVYIYRYGKSWNQQREMKGMRGGSPKSNFRVSGHCIFSFTHATTGWLTPRHSFKSLSSALCPPIG